MISVDIMANFNCSSQRLYYVVIILVLCTLLILETITLAMFSAEHNHISVFWKEYIEPESESRVCILYGGASTDGKNPTLTSAPLCSVMLFGISLIMLVLIAWIIVHIVMEIMGCPQM